MKSTVQDITQTRKEILVNLEEAEVQTQRKAVLEAFGKQAKIPGFRPGKAPESVILKRYSKEVAQELNQRVAAEAYDYMNKESGVNVYTLVDMKEVDCTAGGPIELTFTVDVLPEFDLPEYKGVEVNVPEKLVEEEDIEKAIDAFRSQRASFDVVERAAEKGDYVKVSYTGTIGGKPVSEFVPKELSIYSEQKGTWEEAGAEKGTPGVDAIVEGLLGMKAGDKKDVVQKFEKDFRFTDLAGQTVDYAIEVLEVRERKLPELTDELLKEFQIKSVEDLRDQLEKELIRQREGKLHADKCQQILDKIKDLVDFPLPESAIEEETHMMLQELLRVELAQGAQPEAMEAKREELTEKARGYATDRVKIQILLLKIAEKESIEIHNDDMQRHIVQEASAQRISPEEFVKELQKDRARVLRLQRNVRFNKTLDLLVKEAKLNKQNKPKEA